MTLNEVVLVGRVGHQPEVRELKGGMKLTTLSVATTNSYKKNDEWIEETDWHNVRTFKFNKLTQKIDKGDIVCVKGSLRHDTYEKDGEMKHSYYVNALVLFPIQPPKKELQSGKDDLPF